ncbi:MAG: hypothetical protein L6R41_008221 [Letrouitia leprolyta]|nr:MAG: hypothetical protein L6R41_008221 [Letrouitia leprolyta]
MISRSALLQTADAVVSAYNSWDIQQIMHVRAANCMNYILPTSLGRKPMNNEEYQSFFISSMPAFEGFHLTVHDTVIDETARKVVMHITSTASTPIGDYHNEYRLTLRMTEDGQKIGRFEEFVDSKYSADFMPRVRDFLSQSKKANM